MENLDNTPKLRVGDKVYMYFYDSIDGSGIFTENSFYIYKEKMVISIDSSSYTVSDGVSKDTVLSVAGGYGTVLNVPIIQIKAGDAAIGNNITYLLNTDRYLTAEKFKELLCNDVQQKLLSFNCFNTNCIKD